MLGHLEIKKYGTKKKTKTTIYTRETPPFSYFYLTIYQHVKLSIPTESMISLNNKYKNKILIPHALSH